MATSSPILGREELRRFPFRKRPTAQPGTALVFQTRNGRLYSPNHPLVSGDVTIGGYQYAYTVDTSPHSAKFVYQTPSRDASLKFDVTVTYTWQVTNPVTVVEQKVDNPTAACEQHLSQLLRPLCRNVDIEDDAEAEAAISRQVPSTTIIPLVGAGLTISAIFVEVRADPLVVEGARTRRKERQEMDRRLERVQSFEALVRSSSAAAVILGDDPSKTREAYEYIEAQMQRDREATLKAMQVVVESGHLQPGELDPAVQAIVGNLTRMMDERTGGGVRSITSTAVERPSPPAQAEAPSDEAER